MKKIVDFRQMICINKRTGGLSDTSIWKHIHYWDEAEIEQYECLHNFKDFESLWAYVADGHILNATCKQNRLLGRYVRFSLEFCCYRVYEKGYKDQVILKQVCNPRPNLTMKELANLLPADEMAEYLVDRGLKIAP